MASFTIRTAAPSNIPQIRAVLAEALAHDPLIQFIIPEHMTARLSRIAIFFMGQVERLVTFGHTNIAVLNNEIVGAALWVPPNTERRQTLPLTSELTQIVGEPSQLESFSAQLRAARTGQQTCDGPYLATFGVLERCRGQGVGHHMLEAAHHHFGPVSTHLESANPQNLSLYKSAGYHVAHQATFADGTTLLTQLIRPASS